MRERDYYELLGVPRNAGEDEIRRAYRKLALEWHPDRNKSPEAEQQFKQVNEAYETLNDPQKRRMYDRYGHVAVGEAERRGFEGFDSSGGLGDLFDAFFGGVTMGAERGPRRGADLHVAIALTFVEAAFGVEKELEVVRSELCGRCKGSRAEPGTSVGRCTTCRGNGQLRRTQSNLFGQFVQIVPCPTCRGEGQAVQTPCSECRGSGRQRRNRKLEVQIPAGVEDGTQLRLTGEGEAGDVGGPPGGLYLTVAVKPHPLFRREGAHLIYELALSFPQAALGDTIPIPLLEGGTEEVKVPAGTQTGSVLRVRGKGVGDLTNKHRGDLLILVRVLTPKHLDGRAKKLLEELHKLLGPEQAR
ncbi:MAG: molecular chaperone DnaJ [Dehalococcoidia bacterium]|nr:molecular chaperone DnaJ [Dehalococcoidia bacterium]